jgi:hypothetical protein
LLELPKEIQQLVADGSLPERDARGLVKLSRVSTEHALMFARRVAKAAPDQRDDVLASETEKFLRAVGRALNRAPFELTWPAKPIVLNDDRPDGAPEMLRACAGCPFHFKLDREHHCAQPVCFDLKTKHFLASEVRAAADRLGVPAAAPEEEPVAVEIDYSNQEAIRRLLKTAKSHPELGLRLVSASNNGWVTKEVLKSNHVSLATLNAGAVKKFLGRDSGSGSQPVTTAKPGTPAAKANAKQETRAREKRRGQRSARLHTIEDVKWLVQSVTPVIAAQLTISGPALRYVVAELVKIEYGSAREFYGLQDFSDALATQIKQATGKEQETLLRQRLVLSQIFVHAFDYFNLDGKLKDGFDGVWERVRGKIETLATVGHKSKGSFYTPPEFHPGLGVQLPRGWDEPPTHHTEYNCWSCNRFASNNYLTKANLAEGWEITRAGNKTLNVFCPDCSQKSRKATKAAPADFRGNSAKATKGKGKTK